MSEAVLLPIEPRKILMPRFDTLGDIILLEGFIEALIKRFPRANVTLLGRRVYADLAPLFPNCLDWLATDIDPHKQMPDVSLCKKLLEDLGDESWDLVLMTAYNRTWAEDLVAVKQSKAKRIAMGQWTKVSATVRKVFTQLGLTVDCPYEHLVSVPEKSHETEKYQILWRALTGESTLSEPRLYINEHEILVAEKILDSAGLKNKNFCVCFPAGTQKVAIKVWPTDRFAEVIVWLERERGIQTLVAGHRSEGPRVEEVVELARAQGARPKQWLGRDGEIPILAALLNAAKLYVGNDTGPMHIAAALNTPVVATFGGGHWPRFIPRGDFSIAVSGEMPCFGCGWDCIFEDAPCKDLVSVDDVKRAVDSLEGRSVKEHILPASKKLEDETRWYIRRAAEKHRAIEADRRERLEANHELEHMLVESEADRAARLSAIEQLGKQLEESEADRAVRLATIEQLGKQLEESEADRAARLTAIEQLGKLLEESEADRAARLTAMERLGEMLARSDANCAALRDSVARLEEQQKSLRNKLQVLQSVRDNLLVRILIRSGLVTEKRISDSQEHV